MVVVWWMLGGYVSEILEGNLLFTIAHDELQIEVLDRIDDARTTTSVGREPDRLSKGCQLRDQPVCGCVGVLPFASRRSNPSGMLRRPGDVPGVSVRPYCQTMLFVRGSMTTTRSL